MATPRAAFRTRLCPGSGAAGSETTTVERRNQPASFDFILYD